MRPLAFSPKQRTVLTWWRSGSPHQGHQAIICDGAVRSGKTLSTGLSFFCWAMQSFHHRQFALCGKTIGSIRRNLWLEVAPILRCMGFTWREQLSRNTLTVTLGRHTNQFYFFSGLDQRSAAGVQGITLAGALLDEVVLMPRSFVNQICARCSVEGSRLWFSCNPDSPHHWFYQEWIVQHREKGALYLSFSMRDNPGLSPATLARYETIFEGAFYQRFVLGQWTAAQGLVYDFFTPDFIYPPPSQLSGPCYISCDYGTVNPTSMGLWGRADGAWYRIAEFYYDARLTGIQKTDEEYADALQTLGAHWPIASIIVDPSAASFQAVLRQRGFFVEPAQNHVLSGIRITAHLLKERKLRICSPCQDAIREFGLYAWDTTCCHTDRVRKLHDHAMDDIRYFAATVAAAPQSSFFAGVVERQLNSPSERR